MLLRDYAITPDVFDDTSYPHPAICDLALPLLQEVLLSEGLVRDLRSGGWRQVFASDGRPWHRRGKELLRKLAQQNRLVSFPPVLATAPASDLEWCEEALGSGRILPFRGGVIATEAVKAAYPDEPLVARIDRLTSAPWWAARSPSVTIPRRLAEYREHLDPVLRCANSLMFIDPHLDPVIRRYGEFAKLVLVAGNRVPAPAIEIHRVCYEGSGASRRFPMLNDPAYFEKRFRGALEAAIRDAGLRLDVFIWDDFHDRYLISDLLGISLPNGLDTTTDPRSVTRWTRLGREDRDDIQREFDQASQRHVLRHRFPMG